MADKSKRLARNVAGEFYVDSTCINCDTCRQLAPDVFDESGDFSFVYAQPQTTLLNIVAVFGFIMGGIAGLVPHIGLWKACAVASKMMRTT